MIYEYDEKIVNRSDEFNNKNNFVGYILPDGSIYESVNHNVSDVYSFFRLYLDILNESYDKKDELLNVDTSNKLANVILKRMKTMSYDEIHALCLFTKQTNFMMCDLLVSFFGCHQVTRKKMQIITSEIIHEPFYNYLLHGFTITTAPKLVFDEEKKEYKYLFGKDQNEYLYDEIKSIRDSVKEEEINLFHK